MANLLVIEKQTGGYFKFTLNGDTATAVTSIQNDLLAVGTQLHFKTGNGANIIKEQFIYPEDVTIISGGTFTFTTVAQVWNKLIEIDYFAWLGNGGTGGVSRFDDLADTFEYVGQAGKVVVVDNSELKLIPVTFYNKRLFTDLEDTPNSLVPNKMVVVNPEGSALILQDQPQAPEQLLNSVGYFDYNDLATQTTPLNAVTNVPLKLVNDTEGANTNTSENPYGVSYVWDYTTNQFNFSELSVGDTIDIRIHVQVTTTTANQKVNLDAKFGIGSVSEFTNSIYENQFKTAGLHEINFVAPFYMGSTYITDYPAELYLITDASATVKVDGWYVRIIRKNINIITVDYEVPDATTLAKGIVRLAGDLGGTANSPTVPGLANKVPTSRIIETTSPLLGGGALTSDLVLNIQQANSVQSGYLSFADWSTFNNKANDAAVVHLAGTETITGLKTFSSDLNVSDLYVNGYSGFSGRLSLKQANSAAFSGIGYTTVNALGTSALSINFRQTDGTNKTMQINANLIGAAARVFQFPDADGTVALTSNLHNPVTIGTANGLSLSTQVLSLGLASASTNGALSSTDWNTFNNKQNALTNPITGTGTANYLPKFTGSTALGNSLIYEIGSTIGIGTTSPFSALHISRNASELLRITRGSVSDFSFDLGASNDLYIKNNGVGTTPLTILGSGNVGIGTTSPRTPLEVFGNGLILSYSTSNASARDYLISTNYNAFGDFTINQANANGGNPYSAGTSRFYINSSGNVGIGTTSPNARLSLSYSSAGNDAISITNTNTGGRSWIFGDGAGVSAGGFGFYDATAASTRLLINSSGNVGIGTTSPVYKFHVNDTSDGIVGHFSGGVSNYTLISFKSNEANVYSTSLGSFNSGMLFRTGATDRMYINSGGNVGIGTTSPDNGLLTILKNTSRATESSYGLAIQSNASNVYTELLLGADDTVDCGVIQTAAKNTSFTTKKLALQPQGGNVGIGTTSPNSYGAGYVGLTLDGSTTSFITARANGVNKITLSANGGGGTPVLQANDATTDLGFQVGGSERMRITSGGNVLIGTTSGSGKFRVEADGSVQDLFQLKTLYASSGSRFISFINSSGSEIGSIQQNGGSNTSYITSSDYRLKEDFKSVNGLDLVSQMKIYDYRWKSDKTRAYGVIAHELQEVVDYAVSGEKDGEIMQGVDYSKLVPILVQAIKELKTEIETLKK